MPHTDKLSKYKTKVKTTGDVTIVTYHTTDIVKFSPVTIVLNFGGWDGVTTRRKMNQASNQFGLGFGVYRRKGITYISYNSKEYKLADMQSQVVIIDRELKDVLPPYREVA